MAATLQRETRAHPWLARVRTLAIALASLVCTVSLWAIPEPLDALDAFRKGEYDTCIRMARTVIHDRPRNEDAHLALIRGLLETGQYLEARDALTNALAANAESLRLRWKGREVFQQVGESKRAEEMTDLTRELISNRPWGFREPANIVVFGRALLEFGLDPKEVLEKVFLPAQKLDPKLSDGWIARGELALDKHDSALAARIWREASDKFPKEPDIWLGLAKAVAGADPQEAEQAIEKALAINPRHIPSLLLLVNQRIDAELYPEAEKLIQEVLAINPWHPEAWAYRAVLAHLDSNPSAETLARASALHFWSSNPKVDFWIGQKLSQKYRFKEGASHQRQALASNPDDTSAKLQLARDELRLGNETEGWQLASEVQEKDPYDIEAYNLVQLRDTMRRFTTLTNGDLILRMEAREAKIYGTRALELLEKARVQLTTKYHVELERPTTIEIFNDQKDFGVRTFGMPENPGFLGVCFGRVVTANSPAANTSQPVNWEAVLWHEFCHAVTLTLTRNRMPRWLSEGLSVYEEIQKDSSWGQRLNPRYREMILKGQLTPVSKLSGAFLSPPSPLHLQFAYFEAEWVVEFLVQRYGDDQLRALLGELGNGLSLATALEKHAAPPADLDAAFEQFAKERANAFGAGLDWTKPPEHPADGDSPDWLQDWAKTRPTNYWALQIRGKQLMESREWAAARHLWKELVALQPQQIGTDAAYWHWAECCRELGDVSEEGEALAKGAERDHEAPNAYERLVELAEVRRDWPEMIRNCERLLAVNPLVSPPYRSLARAQIATGHPELAIKPFQTLLELDPPNPADVEFQLARVLQTTGDGRARVHLLRCLEETPRRREALHLLWELGPTSAASPPAGAAAITP